MPYIKLGDQMVHIVQGLYEHEKPPPGVDLSVQVRLFYGHYIFDDLYPCWYLPITPPNQRKVPLQLEATIDRGDQASIDAFIQKLEEHKDKWMIMGEGEDDHFIISDKEEKTVLIHTVMQDCPVRYNTKGVLARHGYGYHKTHKGWWKYITDSIRQKAAWLP